MLSFLRMPDVNAAIVPIIDREACSLGPILSAGQNSRISHEISNTLSLLLSKSIALCGSIHLAITSLIFTGGLSEC